MLFRGAVVTDQRRTTPDRLLAIEEAMAGALREAGASRASRVAVAVEDPATFLAATYAASRIGSVPVLIASGKPVNPDGALLGEPLLDAEPEVVVADAAYADHLAGHVERSGAALLLAGREGSLERIRPKVDRSRAKHPEEAGLLLYTSGSESTPKGVLWRKDVVEASARALADDIGLRPDDRLFISVPLSHGMGFNHARAAQLAGATVVTSDCSVGRGELATLLAKEAITAAALVPHHFRVLFRRASRADFPNLRLVVMGASTLVKSDVELALESLPELRILARYGMTEVPRCTRLDPSDVPRLLPSIGRPWPGVELELRDEGVAWIKSSLLMIGYWKRPEDTAAVLQDGWFCTRDVMRKSEDGNYWIEGRQKETLNCGGEKLSPEVIEHYILDACGVREVAVVSMSDAESSLEQVVAVVSHAEGVEVTLDSVREACKGKIHRAFFPVRLVRLEALPRTASGKLDRARVRRELTPR